MGRPRSPTVVGGGIYNDHATLTLNNCTISGNTADQGSGGGIYNDGYGGSATLTVTNCTISGNSAWPGGGIYNYGGTHDDHQQHSQRQLGRLTTAAASSTGGTDDHQQHPQRQLGH